MGRLGRRVVLFVGLAAGVLAGAGAAAAQEGERQAMTSREMPLEQIVGPEVFARAGLGKLSPQEQMTLAEWIRGYTKQVTDHVEEICRRHGPGGPPPWR